MGKRGVYYLHATLFERDIWDISIPTFIFMCAMMVAGTVALGGGFWLSAKMRCKLENPPPIRPLRMMSLDFQQAVVGVSIGMFGMALPVFILYLCMGGNKAQTSYLGLFNGVSGDFIHQSLSADIVRNGRYGLCFCVLGILILVECVKILVPKNISKRADEIQRCQAIRIASRKTLNGNNLENESKIGFIRFTSGIVILYSLFVIFFSFSKEYSSSRQLMYLAGITMVGELLKKKILDSSDQWLLAVPFLVVIEIMNLFVARLSSHSFNQVYMHCS